MIYGQGHLDRFSSNKGEKGTKADRGSYSTQEEKDNKYVDSYIKFGIGLNIIPLASTVDYFNRSYESYLVNTKPYSTGKGLQINFSYGRSLSKYASLEFGVSHLFGGKAEYGALIRGVNFYEVDNFTRQVNLTNINSSIKLSIPSTSITSFYSKFGLLFGFAKSEVRVNYFYYQYDRNYDEVGTAAWTDFGGTGLGFSGAIGMESKMSENVSFYTEIYYQNLNVTYKRGERTSQIVNGQSVLDNFSKSFREWTYEKEVDSRSIQDPDEPSKFLATKDFMGVIGLHFGLKIIL